MKTYHDYLQEVDLESIVNRFIELNSGLILRYFMNHRDIPYGKDEKNSKLHEYSIVNPYKYNGCIKLFKSKYLNALNEMKNLSKDRLTPFINNGSRQELKELIVREVKDEYDNNNIYLRVSGVPNDPNEFYIGVEYCPWTENLNIPINEECINEIGIINCMAAILFEFTYNGYTEEQVNNHIKESFNEY